MSDEHAWLNLVGGVLAVCAAGALAYLLSQFPINHL